MSANIRIAILGPGKIAHRFVKGLKACTNARLVAVCGRDQDKTAAFARQYEVERVLVGYETLYQQKDIDAVYIATPPFLHYQQVMDCLNSGFHVICEKPFLLNELQIKKAFALAYKKQLTLMEAMKSVFLPATLTAKAWIKEGRIGELRLIEASYSYKSPYEHSHWVFDKSKGGGGMFDVGVYAMAYANTLVNSPLAEIKHISFLNELGSDDFSQFLVRYQGGVIASLRGGIGLTTENKAMVYGTKGYLEVPDYWKANTFRLFDNNKTLVEQWQIDQPTEFKYQIQAFVDAINRKQTEVYPMDQAASLQLMQCLSEVG